MTIVVQKSSLKIVILLLLIVAGLLLWVSFKSNFFAKPAAILFPEKQTLRTTKRVDPASVPAGMPKDLPEEAGSEILANNFIEQQDGRLLANRQFISLKTTSENYTLYKDYLVQSGWALLLENEGTAHTKSLFAEKNSQHMNIVISTHAVTAKTIVDITWQRQIKKP